MADERPVTRASRLLIIDSENERDCRFARMPTYQLHEGQIADLLIADYHILKKSQIAEVFEKWRPVI